MYVSSRCFRPKLSASVNLPVPNHSAPVGAVEQPHFAALERGGKLTFFCWKTLTEEGSQKKNLCLLAVLNRKVESGPASQHSKSVLA